MKKFIFSISILMLSLASLAQSPYPCTQSFAVVNNGNGGQGCPTTHPDDAAFRRDGSITIKFTNAIGSTVAAPSVLTVEKMVNGVLQGVNAMKFVFKTLSADRTVAEYCFYTTNNAGLFNGTGVSYVFSIQYDGLDAQVCNPITQVQSTLPVLFRSFTADRNKQSVNLKWETAVEENNNGFEVQSKTGAEEWKTLVFVASQAKSGFSETNLSYSYAASMPSKGSIQFRIRQVDFDGKSAYSETRIVRGEGQTASLSVFPNPSVCGIISVVFANTTSLHDVQVYDQQGRVVKQFAAARNSQQLSGFVRGQYLVSVKDRENGEVSTQKLIVQ